MPEIMQRSPRRARRARKKKALAFSASLIAVALAAVIVFYAFFYPKKVEKVVYPLAYREEINRYAREYFLDPARVAAVIYCESSFRPDAVSPAGAVGLMQLMPETGEWIAGKLKEAFAPERLTDPATNIRYGCWYLDYLGGVFDADFVKVTAAYHAGDNTVRRWLKDSACSSDGVQLEHIPSDVTSAYVERVAEMTEKYKEIMDS